MEFDLIATSDRALDIVNEFVDKLDDLGAVFGKCAICMALEEYAKKYSLDVVELAKEIATHVEAVNAEHGKY